jgi:hypothetical protein
MDLLFLPLSEFHPKHLEVNVSLLPTMVSNLTHLSDLSFNTAIRSESTAARDRSFSQAAVDSQSVDILAISAFPPSSQVSLEADSSNQVFQLRQAETRTFKTAQQHTNQGHTDPIKFYPQPPPLVSESPQWQRDLSSPIHRLEYRATELYRPLQTRATDRQAHSEVAQPTQELVRDPRQVQSTPVLRPFSPLSSHSDSNIASDQISDWIDETMNPQAPEFSSRLQILDNHQSNAIIIGDGRLSPTRNGTYGRSGQVSVANNVPRVSSMAGIIENAELQSPSVRSSISQRNVSLSRPSYLVSTDTSTQDATASSSARPSYRYLLENPEARAQCLTAYDQSQSQSSRQISSESRRQQRQPAGYITAHLDDREGENRNSHHQSVESARRQLDQSRKSNLSQNDGISHHSAQTSLTVSQPTQDASPIPFTSHQMPNPRCRFSSEDQDIRNQAPNTTNQSLHPTHTNDSNVQQDSNPSFRSIPIYYDTNHEELVQPQGPPIHPHASYGSVPIPLTPNTFLMAPPSPYSSNFVPPPPRHLDPVGTPADDMYRHLIALHHEIAAYTSALKDLIAAKHDNIVDRIFQRHDAVVDKLRQGLLQIQHILLDMSTHLAHVDGHMASNSAGLDVRMRLVQDAMATVGSGQDRIMEEVQNIIKSTGDILNLLNAVNQRFTALEAAVEANKCSCSGSARQGTGSNRSRCLEGHRRGPQANPPRKNHAVDGGNGDQRPPHSSARAESTGFNPTASTGGSANIEEPDIRQHPAFSGMTAAAGSSPRVFTPPVVGGDWYRQVTGKRE